MVVQHRVAHRRMAGVVQVNREAIHQVFLRAAIECAEQGATAEELVVYLMWATKNMASHAVAGTRGDALVSTLREELTNPEPEEDDHAEPCPDCGTLTVPGHGGGIRCPAPGCGWWFCY